MTTAEEARAIKSAMSVARDVAEGRLLPSDLAQEALEAARGLFGTVAGPNDALWPLQADVARQVLAFGGVPANELAEWLAVQRAAEPVPERPPSWIELVLADVGPDDEGEAA